MPSIHTNNGSGLEKSVNHLRQSVANKGGRGGRRPGAGAPPGNMNALKHGRTSHFIRRLTLALAAYPDTREALIRMARRQRAQKRQAERTAALLLSNLLERCLIALKNNQTPDGQADTDRALNAILFGNNQPLYSLFPNQSEETAPPASPPQPSF